LDGAGDIEQELRDLERLDVLRAQESFLAYYMRMTGFLPPHHIKVIAKLLQAMENDVVDRAMLFAPPRHAKRIADDTKVLTANRGWTTHGNLQSGDFVWHPSGKPARVMGVSQPGESDLLVTFSNGDQIQCDKDHLWTVWDRAYSSRDRYRRYKTWETVTTAELIARGVLLSGQAGQRGARYRWHLPEVLGVDGAEIPETIGPYTLGAWLGDGSSAEPRLTLDPKDMDAIVSGIIADGYRHNRTFWHKETGVPTVDFCTPRHRMKEDGCSLLRMDLEAEGVLHNKHIPEKWITSSRQQRKSLLAGLMDTDGHCEARSGRCRFVTASRRLADGVFDLCASLGYRPYITVDEMNKSRAKKGCIQTKSDIYTVGFQPFEEIPCKVLRKRPTKFALRRSITIRSIERTKPKSCRCIKVSAQDGLYLVGRGMIPTHNTLTGTTLFPSWIMGRNPRAKLMSVVHTERYAGKVGRAVRNLMKSPQWPFEGVTLAQDSQAKDQWATPQGGEYNAFGATGGNQHGNPAEWLFMDDLVKGRAIAMSPHMREEIWEIYKSDLLSRLQGRAKQLMVFTRWHEDDPAGRILPQDFDGSTGWYRDRETGEKWYVLSLPAVAEHDGDPLGRKPGEWLWPEMFGESKLGGMRKRGGWVWSSLFQQRPSPEEGLMFTRDHISYYDPTTLDKTRLQIYISSDYAVTDEAGAPDPDYTVHQVWGVDDDWNLYLLDMWRGRTTSDVWIEQFVRLVLKWKPLRAFEEGGQIIKGVGPFITRELSRNRAYVNRIQLTSSTSKEQRAHSLLGMAAMGKMFLPKRETLTPAMFANVDAFEKELLTFPTGRHDDCVDPATLLARGIDRMAAGKSPDPKYSPQTETLDDLWSRYGK